MSKKPAPSPIDDLLADLQPQKRPNIVADNEPLARAIRSFLTLKAEGDERVAGITLRWFYNQKLQALHDGPVYFGTIRKYVREHLRLDYLTGKAL
jgi:acyl carrier protein phosphodiesterase